MSEYRSQFSAIGCKSPEQISQIADNTISRSEHQQNISQSPSSYIFQTDVSKRKGDDKTDQQIPTYFFETRTIISFPVPEELCCSCHESVQHSIPQMVAVIMSIGVQRRGSMTVTKVIRCK